MRMTGKLEDTARMAKNVWSHAEVGSAAQGAKPVLELKVLEHQAPPCVMFCISQL